MPTGSPLLALILFALVVYPVCGVSAGKGDVQARPRPLLITVLQTADEEVVRELLGHGTDGGRAVTPRHRRYVHRTQRYRDMTRSGQVRVLEGQTAVVEVGRVVPEVRLLWVEGNRRRTEPGIGFGSRLDSQGFRVRAVLEGEQVRVEIQHYGDVLQPSHVLQQPQLWKQQPQQMLKTTLTGDPGAWLDLGGTLYPRMAAPAASTYSTYRRWPGEARVLVRVDLAD